MNYTKLANDFAKKHGIKLHVLDKDYRRYFPDDKEMRWVFKLRLERRGKQYTFTFGQSLNDGDKAPDMYDVLACFVKYDPESYENFLSEYGYADNRNAEKTYKAVCKEYQNVEKLFGDIMDELKEIE